MKKFLIFLAFLALPLVADEPLPQPPPAEKIAAPKKQAAPEVRAKTDKYESAFMKTIFILIAIVILVILTIWMFRRLSHSRFSKLNYLKNIKILEKRPLSPKSMLYLIEVGEKQILLAESQIEVRTLGTLSTPDQDPDHFGPSNTSS